MIWDGEQFTDLDNEISERGAIPLQFPVITEFPTAYWERILQYRYGFGFDHGLFLHQITYSFTPYVEWFPLSDYMPNAPSTIHYCAGVSTIKHNGKGHRIFYHFSSRTLKSWEELRDFVIQWIVSHPVARYQSHVSTILPEAYERQPDYEFVEGRDLYVEVRIGEVY